MRRTRCVAVTVLAALVGLIATVSASAEPTPGVKTAKEPYLQPAAPGVRVDPILSTGDIVGDVATGYQMSGVPDGLGAYPAKGDDVDKGRRTFNVVMNHELDRTFPAPGPFNPGVDARISKLVIDAKSRSVLDAEYQFTGLENFTRFCSSTLAFISGRPLYFTGEETFNSGHLGSSIVLDPETGTWRETRHFGLLQHENIVPLKLRKWVFLTTDDDFRTMPVRTDSYLYAYIANSAGGAINGTQGSLHVWVADDETKTGNATVVKNEAVPGRFVPIPQTENDTSDELKAAAAARGAFKFDRLEDVAVHPDMPWRTWIADTGKPPTTTRGRVYQFDFSRNNPTRATLRMILNGDGPDSDDIFNPDNMDASERVLVIQEDRESAFRGSPNRVLTYNFRSKAIRTVATVQTPDLAAPFTWESSGVIDARDFLGRNWWLLDVQAHSLVESQPGPSLAPNSATGEDGQLLAIFIPRSQGGGH